MDRYIKRAIENRLEDLRNEVKKMDLGKEDEAYKVFWKDEIDFLEKELSKND